MKIRLAPVAAALARFFSPAEFERRSRQRERVDLVAELEDLNECRSWCASREPLVVKRLRELARLDSEAERARKPGTVPPGAEYNAAQGYGPGETVRGPNGLNFIFLSGAVDALPLKDKSDRRFCVVDLDGLNVQESESGQGLHIFGPVPTLGEMAVAIVEDDTEPTRASPLRIWRRQP